MTQVMIDTLKVSQRLQESGFTRKQAAGAAEILADLLADRPNKDAVIEAIQESAVAINRRIEASERRLGERIDGVKADVDGLKTDVAGLRTDVAGLNTTVENIQTMMVKLMEGQAVLLQNDMELKRRLDFFKPPEAAD